jgi:hypothetical protein
MAEQAGGERVSAVEQIVQAREAAAAGESQGSQLCFAGILS